MAETSSTPHRKDENNVGARGEQLIIDPVISTTSSTTSATSSSLPPWLALHGAHAAPSNLIRLRRDLTSHLSSREIERVISSIQCASCGDLGKVAGASDFCSLLVNALEMTDVSALCAAAFHYATSVLVRERELMSLSTTSTSPDDAHDEESESLGYSIVMMMRAGENGKKHLDFTYEPRDCEFSDCFVFSSLT